MGGWEWWNDIKIIYWNRKPANYNFLEDGDNNNNCDGDAYHDDNVDDLDCKVE